MICARPEIVMASAQAPANCATFNIASEICFPRSAGNGAELEAALAECSFQGGSVQPVNFEAGRHFAACCGCSKLQCSQSISVFVLRTKQKLHQREVRRASLILGPFAQSAKVLPLGDTQLHQAHQWTLTANYEGGCCCNVCCQRERSDLMGEGTVNLTSQRAVNFI